MSTHLNRTTKVLFGIVMSFCVLAQPYMAAAQSQLNSASFELDVRGAGGTGADGASSAGFGLENSAGPVFTLADVTPPTVPTGVGTTTVAATTVALSWIASTDDVGVTGYEIYRDGVLVSTVGGTSFSDSGLTANTTYSYEVVAIDAVGNRSATSTPLVQTTPEATVSGGGGGGSSDPNTPDEDPEEDYGVAITQLAPNDTSVALLGEVLDGDNLQLYFIVSDTDTEPKCTSSLTRYSVSGLRSEGDVVSLTISGLDSGTRHYARLCGLDSDDELVAASAVDSFQTTGEAPEDQDVDDTIDDVTGDGDDGSDNPLNPVNPGDSNPSDGGGDDAGDSGDGEGDGSDGSGENDDSGDTDDGSGDGSDGAGENGGDGSGDGNGGSGSDNDGRSPADVAEMTPEERYDAIHDDEIEEHEIGYVNNGDVFSVTQLFKDGSEVTVTVWPDSVLDADGNPVGEDRQLFIIISEHFLPLELMPEFDLKAISIGGVIFEIKVVDQSGNTYHNFDPDLMLEIDIAWPEDMEIPDELALYYLERGDAGWTQISEAVFEGTTVIFGVDHLTVFGAWGVLDRPLYMPLEDGYDANGNALTSSNIAAMKLQSERALRCGVIFGFLPTINCWPWWVWLVLIAILFVIIRSVQKHFEDSQN